MRLSSCIGLYIVRAPLIWKLGMTKWMKDVELDSDFFSSHYAGLVSKFLTPHFLSISVPREKDKDILHKSVVVALALLYRLFLQILRWPQKRSPKSCKKKNPWCCAKSRGFIKRPLTSSSFRLLGMHTLLGPNHLLCWRKISCRTWMT